MVLASRLDFVVIAVYMALMLLVGVLLSYYNKTDSDFFKSGNKLPWWLSGISLFMSMFSVWTFTGAAGLAWRAPGVAVTMYLTNALVVIAFAWFLAGRWRRTRAVTIMSYLSERYGIPTNQLYSWTHLAACVVQAGVQLLALGTFISVAMGTDLVATIIVSGLIITVYCFIGGLWAVVVTDTLQFIVLFACAVVVMLIGVHEIGGIEGFVTRAPQGWWSIQSGDYSWAYILAYSVIMFFAFGSGAPVQRYFSVRNEREARKTALVTMVLFAFSPALFFIPPIAARLTGLDLTQVAIGLNAPEESAYVGFCLKYLPHGALGIMLSAMLAATMSSLSSVFNAYAGVITEDLIRQVFWKKASGRKLLLLGRAMTAVFGLLIIASAVVQSRTSHGVFELMMAFSGVVLVPAGVPVVFGLFYRRTPRWAAIASYSTGLALGLLYLKFGTKPTFTQQVFVIGGISTLIYFLPGLFLRPKGAYREQLDRFFAKLATPIAPEEVGEYRQTDLGSYRITGWITLIMGGLGMCLAAGGVSARDSLVNLGVGGLIFMIGAVMLAGSWIARRLRAARDA